MEQLFELFLKSGLRPILFEPEMMELEREVSKSELFTLLMLQFRGESTTSELAADLGVPLSTFTSIGQRLSRRGLIERKRNPKDRRIILVNLTPEGRALADRARTYVELMLQRVQAALTEEELTQFISLLLKVLRAVQADAIDSGANQNTAVRRIPIEG
jgi:DNA-binding MarR family transcriptional regulator